MTIPGQPAEVRQSSNFDTPNLLQPAICGMTEPALGDGLRVLSLDGPPLTAAALSELFFLQQIAHRWAFDTNEEIPREGEDVHVSEMFDIIGGCGIGGLYAILFARLDMTIGKVIEFHNVLLEKLFYADCWAQKDRKKCSTALDDALDTALSHLGVTVDLNSSLFSVDCTKCFVILLNENTTNSQPPRCLRSYRVRTASSLRSTIRQALHATLADLEHFPAVTIDGEQFISTSAALSNPSRILLKDLAITFPKAHLACCVNLGADRTRPANDSSTVGQDILTQFRDLGCFFRLSVVHELHAESNFKSLVMGHLQEADVSMIADDAVEAIKGRKRVVSCLRLGNLAGEDGRNEMRADVSHLRNEEDIKRALEKIRAPFNFRPLQDRGCLEGTREDVLQQIEGWSEDVDGPNVFWLEGYPGTGKTAISISLKQRLAAAHRLGASCFFRRENASSHALGTLFRSIAFQLAHNYSFFRDNIVQTVTSESVNLESSPSILFEKLVYDPLSAAHERCNGSIVIIVDAMDEFGQSEDDQQRLLKHLLPRWAQLPKRCKLFITSRNQGDLPLHLDLSSHRIRRLEVGEAVSSTTQSDIRTFFQRRFGDIQESWRTTEAFLRPTELEALVDAASGLFIWASTVVEMVKKTGMRKPAQKFLRDVCNQSPAAGQTRMQSLYTLYRTVLEPLMHSEEPGIERSEEWVIKQTFFSALVCAKTPLSARALSAMCMVDVENIEDLARKLSPVMDAADGLRFVHKSFVDYLLSREFPFQIDLGAVEHSFVLSGFEIMQTQLHFNMGKMPSSYMLNSEIPKLREALSEELRYASRFWGVHLAGIQNNEIHEKDNPVVIFESIKDFLDRRLLYWLEAVSILGSFAEAMTALWTVKEIGLGQAPSDFAHDALAFLRQFAFPISWSYAHIYVSALPWAPTRSLVRQKYIGTIPKVFKIVSNGDVAWPAHLATIRGHNGHVKSVACSPDGSQIVSGSSDNTIRIWDATTRQLVGEPLRGHSSRVKSVAFSPDGSQIVSGSSDNTIRVWDATTRQQVGEPLGGHNGSGSCIAYSPDGSRIVSGANDNSVYVWDATTQQMVGKPLQGHKASVSCIAFSPNGSLFVSGSYDTTLRIWNTATHQPVGEPVGEPLRGPDFLVSAAFSPDSSRIVVGPANNSVRVWDTATQQPVGGLIRGHSSRVNSVAFSPDGSRIVDGSSDGTVCIWDATTHQPVGEPLRGHSGSVLSVGFSPDGFQIVSGSDDTTIHIWDAVARQPVEDPLAYPSGSFLSIAFSPDGSQIVSGSSDNTIRIWDATTHQPVGNPLRGHSRSVRSVAFSPNGSQIVSSSDDGTVRIWDIATQRPVGEPLRGHSNSVRSVAFSPNGSRIASSSDDGTVRIWDATTQQPVGEPLLIRGGPVPSVTFSPDGFQIASGSYDKTVRIWDTATRLQVGEPLRGHGGSVSSVSFSPDSSQVVSGSFDGTVRIWDSTTHQEVGEPLRGHNAMVSSVAYSPDGSQIASGSSDATIRIWDTATHQPVGEPLRSHRGSIFSVAFSPDGSQIVSGSWDHTIRIWDIATRQSIGDAHKIFKTIVFPHASHALTPNLLLSDDGWLIDPEKYRVVWIPHHLHEFLPRPNLVDIIGARGIIEVDMSDMRVGTEWPSCIEAGQ